MFRRINKELIKYKNRRSRGSVCAPLQLVWIGQKNKSKNCVFTKNCFVVAFLLLALFNDFFLFK